MTSRTMLVLESASPGGSVALVRGARLLAATDIAAGGRRSERLMPAVVDTLRGARLTLADVDAVVCGAGPGGFTGLRISASIAKGIAMARGIPLYAISSLLLMVASVDPEPAEGDYLATLDAMRDESYVALVSVSPDGRLSLRERATIVPRSEVAALAARLGARTIGTGGDIDAAPHARGAPRLSDVIAQSEPVSLDGWEPDYGRLAEAQVRWERATGRSLAG
jgi:tRNA threonylcarbamoyladenosine biosynthesis protein TsaB